MAGLRYTRVSLLGGFYECAALVNIDAESLEVLGIHSFSSFGLFLNGVMASLGNKTRHRILIIEKRNTVSKRKIMV